MLAEARALAIPYVTRMKQTEITCVAVVELVTSYLEDVMPSEERSGFEQHLHACPRCLTYLLQIKQTSALGACLRSAARDDPGASARLVALVRARRGAKATP
jgi:anti-sigma factor RsiW